MSGEDHDMLIEMKVELHHVHECVKLHFKHHWAIMLVGLPVLITNSVALVVLFIQRLVD